MGVFWAKWINGGTVKVNNICQTLLVCPIRCKPGSQIGVFISPSAVKRLRSSSPFLLNPNVMPFFSFVVVPRIHFTHKHCPVCFSCLCMLVAPSQKEDLIATVMAGKIIPTHLLCCKNELFCFSCCCSPWNYWLSRRADASDTLEMLFSDHPHDAVRLCTQDIQVQPVEELKQHKSYLKLLKKQSKELKELRKKHLKKVKTVEDEIETFLLHKLHHRSAWHRMKKINTQWMQQLCSTTLRCGIWVRSRRVGAPRYSLIRRGGGARWRRTSNVASRKSELVCWRKGEL